MGIERTMARVLGVVSGALGVIYVIMPGRYSALLGCPPTRRRRATVFLVGIQELVAMAGLLSRPRPTPFLWYRVAGDVVHAAMLMLAMRARDTDGARLGPALAGAMAVGATDLVAALANRQRDQAEERTGPTQSSYVPRSGIRASDGRSVPVERSITVNRRPEEVYGLWRDLRNLPRFMENLEEVRVLDDRRSLWRAKAPLGTSVEWDAEITEDRPNELIAWRTLAGDVGVSGRVRFQPTIRGDGTVVEVELEYAPPAGVVGAIAAKVLREEPTEQVAGDLRRFKQVAEVGEVVVSEATVGDGTGLKQRAAQPPVAVG